MEQSLIRKINQRYAESIGNMHSIYAGISTTLIGYKKGIIELELIIDPRWKYNNEETALRFAGVLSLEEELLRARGYRVWIYFTSGDLGFSPNGKRALKSTLEDFKKLGELPPVLEAVVEDFFQQYKWQQR